MIKRLSLLAAALVLAACGGGRPAKKEPAAAAAPSDWKAALAAAAATDMKAKAVAKPECGPMPDAQDWKALADWHARQGPPPERRFELGRYLVIENSDEGCGTAKYIGGTTLIASSTAEAERVRALLKALFPKLAGGPTGPDAGLRLVSSLNAPRVATLEEHMSSLAEGSKRSGSPVKLDLAAIRKELETDLRGRDAVVLRYIHVE
jgi:hypothetical protein